MEKDIPLLTASDVELRIAQLQQTNQGTFAVLLAYKNSRVDMRILDECFGSMNWKREHTVIDGRLFCTVSVYDEKKQEWISKQDVGVPSNTEPTKGEASDAFKRACFNWKIGRELYSAPDIRFKLNDDEFFMGTNGKPKSYAKFYVGADMTYDKAQNKFTKFVVLDNDGKERFSITSNNRSTEPNVDSPKAPEMHEPPFGTICCQCNTQIKSQKVLDYALNKFGKPICYDCQKRSSNKEAA